MSAPILRRTFVLVMDGARALLFRNEGFDDAPNLTLALERSHADPPDRELGADRPGRFARKGHPMSALDEPSLHDRAESRFAAAVAQEIEGLAKAGGFEGLVLFADPRTLGRVRPLLGPETRARLRAERGVDLAHAPTSRIEAAFHEAIGS